MQTLLRDMPGLKVQYWFSDDEQLKEILRVQKHHRDEVIFERMNGNNNKISIHKKDGTTERKLETYNGFTSAADLESALIFHSKDYRKADPIEPKIDLDIDLKNAEESIDELIDSGANSHKD